MGPLSSRAALASRAALIVSLLVGAHAARAEGITGRQRVAVVRVDFEGSVSEAARELFAGRVVEGLAAAQFEVFSGAAVAQKLALGTAKRDLSGCRDGACYPAVAQALAVGYLVAGRVAESNKNYEVSLELINGRTGGVIGTSRESCETCGLDEAGEKMALAASALRARLEVLTKAPARFIVRSRPAGVAVKLDGVGVGRTPLDRELGGGEHRFELAAAGYDALDRRVTVVSGVDETLDLELVPLPTKFPYRKAGWSAVAIGAAALVAGIWMVAIDGDEIACGAAQRDPFGHCPHVRNTRALGAALVGVGGVVATLGGTWIYLSGGPGVGGASGERAELWHGSVSLRGSF
jgi:TolB-like protein